MNITVDHIVSINKTLRKYPAVHIVSKRKLPICSSGMIVNCGHVGFSNSVLTNDGWVLFDDMWKESKYDFCFYNHKSKKFEYDRIDYIEVVNTCLYVIETEDGVHGAFDVYTNLLSDSGWVKATKLLNGDSIMHVNRGEK